jgi:hypothetical protein
MPDGDSLASDSHSHLDRDHEHSNCHPADRAHIDVFTHTPGAIRHAHALPYALALSNPERDKCRGNPDSKSQPLTDRHSDRDPRRLEPLE